MKRYISFLVLPLFLFLLNQASAFERLNNLKVEDYQPLLEWQQNPLGFSSLIFVDTVEDRQSFTAVELQLLTEKEIIYPDSDFYNPHYLILDQFHRGKIGYKILLYAGTAEATSSLDLLLISYDQQENPIDAIFLDKRYIWEVGIRQEFKGDKDHIFIDVIVDDDHIYLEQGEYRGWMYDYNTPLLIEKITYQARQDGRFQIVREQKFDPLRLALENLTEDLLTPFIDEEKYVLKTELLTEKRGLTPVLVQSIKKSLPPYLQREKLRFSSDYYEILEYHHYPEAYYSRSPGPKVDSYIVRLIVFEAMDANQKPYLIATLNSYRRQYDGYWQNSKTPPLLDTIVLGILSEDSPHFNFKINVDEVTTQIPNLAINRNSDQIEETIRKQYQHDENGRFLATKIEYLLNEKP